LEFVLSHRQGDRRFVGLLGGCHPVYAKGKGAAEQTGKQGVAAEQQGKGSGGTVHRISFRTVRGLVFRF
jgi:hypothetical protein